MDDAFPKRKSGCVSVIILKTEFFRRWGHE